MQESGLEQRLKREVERRGGLARKLITPGAGGAQDRLILMPGGRVWFVELKAPGRRPRPLQVHRANELRALGFQVRIISTVGELDEFLVEVDKHAISAS